MHCCLANKTSDTFISFLFSIYIKYFALMKRNIKFGVLMGVLISFIRSWVRPAMPRSGSLSCAVLWLCCVCAITCYADAYCSCAVPSHTWAPSPSLWSIKFHLIIDYRRLAIADRIIARSALTRAYPPPITANTANTARTRSPLTSPNLPKHCLIANTHPIPLFFVLQSDIEVLQCLRWHCELIVRIASIC